MNPIYLDYNATTPIIGEVAQAMKPYLEAFFGNPSSSHVFGVATRNAVEKGRGQLATLLNCDPHEVVFTSGGTESNNYALKGYAFANKDRGNHIITSSVEHPAIIEVCHFLETQGFEITYLPVDEKGRVCLEDVAHNIRPTTIIISVMYANNEVGTIQPIAEIAALAHENGIVMHSDCAQAVGKISVDVKALGVDLLSVAGHKLYGPKGIGALYIREGIKLQKLIHGANHERNLRAGTENVLEIVGFGQAAEVANRDLQQTMIHDQTLRDRLQRGLENALVGVSVNGNMDRRLPNTLSISFEGIKASDLLSTMDSIAASAGAACHSHGVSVSSTLSAMNVPMSRAIGTIRFSTGRFTTQEDIDEAIAVIVSSVNRMRK